jgi:hypothetical protein
LEDVSEEEPPYETKVIKTVLKERETTARV